MESENEEIEIPNINIENWRKWDVFPKIKKLHRDWYKKSIKQQLIKSITIILFTYLVFSLILPKIPRRAKKLEPIQSSLDEFEPGWFENWFIMINDTQAIKVNKKNSEKKHKGEKKKKKKFFFY